MKRLSLAAVAAAFFAVACVPKANAMSYSYRLIGSDTTVIDATGEIAYNEQATFSAWLKTIPADAHNRQHFAIVLNSNGGNPFGAFEMGEAIRKAGGNTGVAENGTCASSCVVMWAAGVRKSVGGTSRIGVHGAYYDRDKLADAGDAKNAPLMGDATTLAIAQQLHVYGAPDNVVVQTIMTPANDIYWLTMKDAADWGANVVQ
jgi:hypothetical protein